MYAVIATGGKQYRVAEGDVIRVEKLPADAGAAVDFNDVLLVADGEQLAIGAPHVEGGKVTAKVNHHGRGQKIKVIKFKRRKQYLKHAGHRQDYTEVTITGISLMGGPARKEAEPKPAEKEPEKPAEPAAAAAEPTAEPAAAVEPEFLDGPKGEPDDLKKISGVGPKLEERLNSLGIYHFWQIAEFKKSDIDKVDDLLNFKGRVERDDWVKQATELAAGKESD
ncbi:MAG: 50S ribosomal protein L21 [Gammaproteobacteria bacterium]